MFRTFFRVLKFFLFPLSLLSLFRCGSGYKEKDGKVTYNGKEIDTSTMHGFVVLNDAFAKDSIQGYFREREISESDGPTFQALDENYAKDKKNVFYCTKTRDSQTYFTTSSIYIQRLSSADPASFVALEYGYAKDKKRAYYEGKPFDITDPDSFSALNSNFSKDRIHAYYRCNPVAKSHGESFEVLDYDFAKDKNHIYYYGVNDEGEYDIHILDCDMASFTRIEQWYSKDKISAFYKTERITGSDPSSFQKLNSEFSKDKSTVYYQTNPIKGADASTFHLLDDYYAKDTTAIFWTNILLQEADPSHFQILELGYATDGKKVFYNGKIVKGADAASFKAYPHGVGDADAEDKHNKFYEGQIVKSE
ncbi:DKNYY domain-containing protein [Cytophagaceae bacterium DM2B3-1]|uniref:DKNYY domain-containing protein n=1 Tax=Xanthocytophaga flava TaxID=3048013 RepID=A0ABT7CP09_9BACT|nr:DKNYY domain-containing protein [Xanthocytophaga flavus]MDJ1466227.1 DKNYY domain-containing protein [Xanthocytophaga flavus]MDJ1495432.1 DKNYY domain-containing protein [Xanthocytophaga flavus]